MLCVLEMVLSVSDGVCAVDMQHRLQIQAHSSTKCPKYHMKRIGCTIGAKLNRTLENVRRKTLFEQRHRSTYRQHNE